MAKDTCSYTILVSIPFYVDKVPTSWLCCCNHHWVSGQSSLSMTPELACKNRIWPYIDVFLYDVAIQTLNLPKKACH